MIDFYGFITTMSWRVGIALEELGLDYRFHSLHLGRAEHRTPEHAARNPMQKVPVVIDHDPKGGGAPITVFESGAILLYLAEKTGRLIPTGPRERAEFWTWFFWTVASYGHDVGLCGAAFHRDPRYRLDKQTDYGRTTYDYFTEASIAAHHKLDARLADREFVGGSEYSLADIAAIGSTVPCGSTRSIRSTVFRISRVGMTGCDDAHRSSGDSRSGETGSRGCRRTTRRRSSTTDGSCGPGRADLPDHRPRSLDPRRGKYRRIIGVPSSVGATSAGFELPIKTRRAST